MSDISRLNQEAARALAYQPDPADWVVRRDGFDHDVLIVGGGQSGVALSFALRHAGVTHVSVVDDADPGRAGIWDDRARMALLRTPKGLPGPDLGCTPLSFPAWYEANHGTGSFEAVGRIARTDWADYLRWFQERTAVAVRHRTRLLRLEPHREAFWVHLEHDGHHLVESARKVVLANGITGVGAPSIPAAVARLPANLYAHTAHDIDFSRLRDRRVGVIGAAASAFDAAAVALEAGAASVDMFCRKPAIPAVQMMKPRAYPGAADQFFDLPDALRWTLFDRLQKAGTPPPPDSISRVTRFPNFHLHLGAEWSGASSQGTIIVAEVNGRTETLDFVIAGTGYTQDPRLRPELADLAGHIALWQDRYRPPAAEANPSLGTYPYFGSGFEFLEREPNRAPSLKNLHCYTNAAALSFGRLIGDVPTMRFGIPRLAAALSRDLFFQDFEAHVRRMTTVPTAVEFEKDLYRDSIWLTEPVGED